MEWSELIQTVLEAVVAVVLPVAVAYAVTWLRAQRDELLSRLDEKSQKMVKDAVAIAVRAAEQSGLAGHIANAGKVKRDYALKMAEGYLASWGVELDVEVLAGMVEAEVLSQLGWKKQYKFRILPVPDPGMPEGDVAMASVEGMDAGGG